MSKNLHWTPEMREQLYALRRQGLTQTEVADRMGLPFEKIVNAYAMIRKGRWGEAAQKEFNGTSIVMRKAAEAKERGLSYGQAQAEKLCEQMTHTVQPEKLKADIDLAPLPELEEIPPQTVGEIPESTADAKPDTARPIDMIAAVDILTACARLFGMDELVETRGSKSHDRAAITFEHGTGTYVLEIFGTYE